MSAAVKIYLKRFYGNFCYMVSKSKIIKWKRCLSKAYYCCKGKCDDILKKKSLSEGLNYDRWEDISSFTNPIGFIKEPTVDEITPRRRTNIR